MRTRDLGIFLVPLFLMLLIATALMVQSMPSTGSNDKGDQQEPIDPKMERGIVEGLGAIRKFSLPDGWKFALQKDWDRGYMYVWIPSSQKFSYDRKNLTSIDVRWSGSPLYAREATYFRSLLSKPPGVLPVEDAQGLKYFLKDLADPVQFNIKEFRTVDIGGTRALRLTGQDLREPFLIDCLYFDCGNDGTIVQELMFICPNQQLSSYKSEWEKALQALRLE